MKEISVEELKNIIENRDKTKRLILQDYKMHDIDMTGWDMCNMDVSRSSFLGSTLNGVNFENSIIENALFDGCSLQGVNLKNAVVCGSCFRNCNLGDANAEGTNFHRSVLELANMTGMKTNEDTKWIKLHCPEKGAFLGYKKCLGDRLVQLLIPADAKRSSATGATCRCSKAKVLTIKSFDYQEQYEEAWSLVDENFVYRVGEWVEVKDFNEDRWFDSTTGIHFWMTRAEAKAY